MGVDYITSEIIMDGEKIKLKIWDTSGQERFRSISQSFYKNTQGVILVFDLSNLQSFQSIDYWIQSLENVN